VLKTPVVTLLASMAGMSAETRERKLGAAVVGPTAGPANTTFGPCWAQEAARVPELVTGEPLTVNSDGNDSDTLVTDPVADTAAHVPSPRRYTVESADPVPSTFVLNTPVVILDAGRLGMSVATRERNPGVPALPFGAAKTRLPAAVAAHVKLNVPVPVTGDPVTENSEGADKPTLVTPPPPPLTVVQTPSSRRYFVPSREPVPSCAGENTPDTILLASRLGI